MYLLQSNAPKGPQKKFPNFSKKIIPRLGQCFETLLQSIFNG
jgi:hypothetical protein